MITLAQLQATFPSNTVFAALQQATFDIWSAEAYAQLNQCRLGTQLDYAALLFVAHNIALEAKAGPTGSAVAPLISKAALGVSAGYDATVTSIDGAGQYNATVYGQRLYRILRGASLGGTYAPSLRGVAGLPLRGPFYRP